VAAETAERVFKEYKFFCTKCQSDHKLAQPWKHLCWQHRRRRGSAGRYPTGCLWCGKPVKSDAVTFFVIRGSAHPGPCAAAVRAIKASSSAEVLAILEERRSK
jgi:hypothetical protein